MKTFPILGAVLLTACAGAARQPEAPLVPFTCTGFPASLTADYYTHANPSYVVLKFNDTDLTLTRTESLEGSKYSDARKDPAEVGSHSWYTKGTEAILFRVVNRANGSRYESQLAYCTSAPQPLRQQPASLPVPGPVLPGTIPGTAPGIPTAPAPAAQPLPQPSTQAPVPASAMPTVTI